MASAPPSRVFSVSEMIIEVEDGPDSTTNNRSEPTRPSVVILCPNNVLSRESKNCQNQKDVILTGMNNAAVKEEDCEIVFEECTVPMDTENSGQDEQWGSISFDPLKPDTTLKKPSVTKTVTSKEVVEPGNISTTRDHHNVQKGGIQSFPKNLEKMKKTTSDPSLPTLQEPNSNTNSSLESNFSKRTRKPTQKMAEFICRLCEQNSYKLIKIFGTQGNQLKLSDKIHFHLPIQVKPSDKLPLGICLTCMNALNVCNDLYQKSLSADSSLRKIFLNENQTRLQSLDCLKPKTSSSAIPSEGKDSGQIESQIIDTQVAQSNLSVPKSKGNKKVDSASVAAEITTQSTTQNKNLELPQKLDNSADAVEADAASVSSVDNEENLCDQDDGNEDSRTDSIITCDLCPEVCSNRLELSKHRKTHPPEQRLKCPDCGKVMPNDNSYSSHRKTHVPVLQPCHICGKILTSTSGLRAHQLLHEDPKFCCQTCGKTFYTLAKLQTHMASHSDERPFSCEICGQSFKLKCTLKQHILTHNERRQFVCDICGHAVNRPSHLRLHMKTHQSGNYKLNLSHSCSQCTFKFRSKKSLMKHTLAVHGDVGERGECPLDLVCSICCVKFPSSYDYGAHIKLCAKAYKCVFCERILASQRSLENHVRGHTGERPYACKFCDEMFKSEPSRDAHQRIHTGERPYKCQKCDKAFRSITNLYQHKATHDADRKYSCPHCKYKTHRPAALRVHLRVHTGEKPYSCDACGKSYKSSWDLKLHSETHLGIRRARRVRPKLTKVQDLALTETSESGDSTGATCAREKAVEAIANI